MRVRVCVRVCVCVRALVCVLICGKYVHSLPSTYVYANVWLSSHVSSLQSCLWRGLPVTPVMCLKLNVASCLRWWPKLLKKSPSFLKVVSQYPHLFACFMLYSGGASLWQLPCDIHSYPLIGHVLSLSSLWPPTKICLFNFLLIFRWFVRVWCQDKSAARMGWAL